MQRESFPEELMNPSMIKKSSAIVKLDPKMVDGLLRVEGRLRHAPIEVDAKYPIILSERPSCSSWNIMKGVVTLVSNTFYRCLDNDSGYSRQEVLFIRS